MFVTISGWGLHTGLRKRKERGENIVNWILVRGVVLISLQFIIGILLPQRYNWNSPGILTLLGLCIILIPLISGLDEYFKKWIKGNSGYYKSVFIVLFTILFLEIFQV